MEANRVRHESLETKTSGNPEVSGARPLVNKFQRVRSLVFELLRFPSERDGKRVHRGSPALDRCLDIGALMPRCDTGKRRATQLPRLRRLLARFRPHERTRRQALPQERIWAHVPRQNSRELELPRPRPKSEDEQDEAERSARSVLSLFYRKSALEARGSARERVDSRQILILAYESAFELYRRVRNRFRLQITRLPLVVDCVMG